MWDFVKNAVVDDLNTVPENLRGLYGKNAEGKFAIADTAKAIVEMYVGQTGALDKSRKDLAAANGEAASRRVTKNAVVDFAKKLGLENIDEENPLTALETHFTDLTGKIKGGSELKVNLDNIKRDYEAKNKQLADAAAASLATMQGSLEKHMIGNAALAALTKHGGNAALLTSIVKGAAKVMKDENGEYSVRILDEAGSPRANGAGGWLDLDGFVGELKSNATYAAAFASDTKSGTGHKPAGNQPAPRRADGEKSSIEKITSGLGKQQASRPNA